MSTLIFGIDCATKAGKAGMVVAEWSAAARPRLVDVHAPRDRDTTMAAELAPAIRLIIEERKATSVLLALDAPLGWPMALGPALARHVAGEGFDRIDDGVDAGFFRRRTDRVIAERYDKTPLEVGADRIARTALAALRLLEGLRKDQQITLPLQPGAFGTGVFAIEVYPAATLRAMGESLPPTKNYKLATDEGTRVRQELLRHIEGSFVGLEAHREKLVATDHAFDALVCVLAAEHFLSGSAVPPSPKQLETARKEGWIWVRAKADPQPKS